MLSKLELTGLNDVEKLLQVIRKIYKQGDKHLKRHILFELGKMYPELDHKKYLENDD